MKKIKFVSEVVFDKFSEIRKLMKSEGYDSMNEFFDDMLSGVIEEKLEEELIDSDCIIREINFKVDK